MGHPLMPSFGFGYNFFSFWSLILLFTNFLVFNILCIKQAPEIPKFDLHVQMILFKIKLWNFEENVKLTYLGFFCVSHMYNMLKCILPCSTTQKIFFLRTKRLDILYHVKFVASKVKLINCQKKKMWLILYELKN